MINRVEYNIENNHTVMKVVPEPISTYRCYSVSEMKAAGLGMDMNGEIVFKKSQDREGEIYSIE